MQFTIHRSISTVAIIGPEDNYANISMRTDAGHRMLEVVVADLLAQGHTVQLDGAGFEVTITNMTDALSNLV